LRWFKVRVVIARQQDHGLPVLSRIPALSVRLVSAGIVEALLAESTPPAPPEAFVLSLWLFDLLPLQAANPADKNSISKMV
jgi:hypothetical protein